VQLCQGAPRKSLLSSESGGERHSTWLYVCVFGNAASIYIRVTSLFYNYTNTLHVVWIYNHTHTRSHILGSGEQAAFIIIYRRNNFTLATNSIRTHTWQHVMCFRSCKNYIPTGAPVWKSWCEWGIWLWLVAATRVCCKAYAASIIEHTWKWNKNKYKKRLTSARPESSRERGDKILFFRLKPKK
jgi:hypothetical protein